MKWLKPEPPTYNCWIERVWDIHHMEQITFITPTEKYIYQAIGPCNASTNTVRIVNTFVCHLFSLSEDVDVTEIYIVLYYFCLFTINYFSYLLR